jgi:hypothetical protein
MMCWNVKRKSTDYLDGRLRTAEHSRIEAHLRQCEACAVQVDELREVRLTLRNLHQPEMPASLRTRLRVSASQERLLLLETRGSRIRRVWARWQFRLNEMMRPLTIPATGGLLSSIILFGALAFTIGTTTQAVVTYEVPVLYADRTDANLVPVELRSAVVLEMTLNGRGRITDYAVRDGSGSATLIGDTTRLQYNNISLPEFPSVLALTQPTNRDISISFIPMLFRP